MMMQHDFAALERIESEAVIDFYRAAPAALRTALQIQCRAVGGATCVSCRGVQPTSMFRRVVMLGVERATAVEELDAVLATMKGCTSDYAVPVAPGTRPAELAAWLEERGFTPGYAWMKFCMPCAASMTTTSQLDVRVVDAGEGDAFGRVVAEGFGMPAGLVPWIAALAGRPDWTCVMAFDGALPVAAGAAYVRGDHAWLGFGATLASHRRRGAQTALLAMRMQEAAARGARIAVTETGERLPEKPSNSYRNILRAGFREAYLRQNYLSVGA